MMQPWRLGRGLAAAAVAIVLASQWREASSHRLTQLDQASGSHDRHMRGSEQTSDRGIGATLDVRKLNARRLAELYGHDGIEDQPEKAHMEQGDVETSRHGSAWKEIREGDSIMMVVQERRSDMPKSLKGSRGSRKGRKLGERHEQMMGNQQRRRTQEDSQSQSQSQSNETACDWEQRRRLHEHLHNVVLVMNYNWGWIARQSMGFWKRVYGPIFDNIVFVSKDEIPEIGLEARGPTPWRNDWRYQFWCLPRIMARFPNADGFLWTNDDVMLNYWNLLKADKTKLWLPNDPSNTETRHFPFDDTAEIKEEEDNNTPEARRKAFAAYNLLDETDRKQFDLSSAPNNAGKYPKRIVDLYYVPKRLSEKLSFDLIPAFREARVYAESAVPSMFYALEHPAKWDHVLDDMVYNWDHWHPKQSVRENYDPAKKWNPDISALHPWKISKPAFKVKMVQGMSQGDSCICQETEFAELCAAKVE